MFERIENGLLVGTVFLAVYSFFLKHRHAGIIRAAAVTLCIAAYGSLISLRILIFTLSLAVYLLALLAFKKWKARPTRAQLASIALLLAALLYLNLRWCDAEEFAFYDGSNKIGLRVEGQGWPMRFHIDAKGYNAQFPGWYPEYLMLNSAVAAVLLLIAWYLQRPRSSRLEKIT